MIFVLVVKYDSMNALFSFFFVQQLLFHLSQIGERKRERARAPVSASMVFVFEYNFDGYWDEKTAIIDDSMCLNS